MAEETWKIILSQEMGGGSGEAAGGGGAGNAGGGAETPNQRKNLFEDAGKVFGAIASVSGMLAILIRSIGGSTVASTFMEVIFKILGALWDLFLIQTLPIFMVLVRWLLSLMPVVTALGQALQPTIQLIADKLEGLLKAVTEWIVPRLLDLAKAINSFATTGDISPLLKWGEKFFKDLFEIVSKLFMDLINWIKENGPKIVDSIGKSVTLFADWLKTNGPNIMNTIVSGIKIMKETLEPLWNQLVATLGPIFEELFKPITDKAKEYFKWMEDSLKVIWDGLMKYFKSVLDVVMVYIKEQIRWLMVLFSELIHIALAPFWEHGDKSGDINKAIVAAWGSMPELQSLPSINNAVEDIKKSIPKLPDWSAAVTTGTNPVVTAVNNQTLEMKKGNDEVKNAIQSTGRTPQSALDEMFPNWGKSCNEADTGAGCSVSRSSNQAQTRQVVLAQWAQNIYQNMTGQKWVPQ